MVIDHLIKLSPYFGTNYHITIITYEAVTKLDEFKPHMKSHIFNIAYLLCDAMITNTGHSHKAVSMLAHCLRRWANIETALGEYPVFAGYTFL